MSVLRSTFCQSSTCFRIRSNTKGDVLPCWSMHPKRLRNHVCSFGSWHFKLSICKLGTKFVVKIQHENDTHPWKIVISCHVGGERDPFRGFRALGFRECHPETLNLACHVCDWRQQLLTENKCFIWSMRVQSAWLMGPMLVEIFNMLNSGPINPTIFMHRHLLITRIRPMTQICS